MKRPQKITTSNLRRLAWKNGFDGVVGLARAIGRSKVTVYRAVKRPHHFGPTVRKLREVLL